METGRYRPPNPEELNKNSISVEVYRGLLYLPVSKERPSFNQLPDRFFLPIKYLGDFLSSVEKTSQDNKERGESIHILLGIRSSGVITGETNKVTISNTELLGFLLKPFPSLVAYHTHPGLSWINSHDVAVRLALGSPLINLVPATLESGEMFVEAVLASEESLKFRSRLSYKKRINTLSRQLEGAGFDLAGGDERADILSKYGLGYYLWSSANNWEVSGTRENIINGKGLHLIRYLLADK